MLLASVGAMVFMWQNTHASKASNPTVGPLPKAPVALKGSAIEGSADAPFALVVFSDFECPYCRSFAQAILPTFRDEYVNTGKVLVSFRHLPLKGHRSARPAAQAAVCAQEQGRFWALHDTFFAQPSSLRDIDNAVSDIGGDTASFVSCKTSERTSRAVESDLELARTLEIHPTPTFLFGPLEHGEAVRVTTRLTGAANYISFKQQLGSFQDGPGR
jgi:protein-disulfide isomerase